MSNLITNIIKSGKLNTKKLYSLDLGRISIKEVRMWYLIYRNDFRGEISRIARGGKIFAR